MFDHKQRQTDTHGPRTEQTQSTGASRRTGRRGTAGWAASNQQLQQQLRERGIQTKLTVSEPDDKYEKEAERVADAVMQMPDPAGTVDLQEGAGPEQIQRMCSRCRRRYRERKPLNCEECEEKLQRKAEERGAVSDGSVERAAAVADRPGRPLPASARSFFEARMGRDFRDVRVHTGPEANRATRSINAEAFTLGRDVVFRTGAYQPGSREGKRLLAQELTHVAQPSEGTSRLLKRQVAEPRSEIGDKTTSEGTEAEKSGIQLESWTDLSTRGGGAFDLGKGTRIGAVYFPTDKAMLDSQDQKVLEELRQDLAVQLRKGEREYNLEFIGYADKRASSLYNLNLGARRAEAVANFFRPLNNLGKASENYSAKTKSLGEFTVEQEGETAQELKRFRRVDIIVRPSIRRPIERKKPETEEPEGLPTSTKWKGKILYSSGWPVVTILRLRIQDRTNGLYTDLKAIVGGIDISLPIEGHPGTGWDEFTTDEQVYIGQWGSGPAAYKTLALQAGKGISHESLTISYDFPNQASEMIWECTWCEGIAAGGGVSWGPIWHEFDEPKEAT